VSDCAHFRELLGGYVLGALEPDEAEALERHLEACPRCRREHAELASVPPLLGMLDTPETATATPPPELEEAVLDRFARERRRPEPARRRLRWRGWAPRVGVAGAVAAVVAALVLAGVFSPDGDDKAFGHVALRGGGGAKAYADLHALRAGTGVNLRVRGLSGGRGRVYELWCVEDDGSWISGGTFRVDERGKAHVSLTSAARPGEYERMLVTRRAGEKHGQKILTGTVDY
jgi:anti-sigma-K factor RskA